MANREDSIWGSYVHFRPVWTGLVLQRGCWGIVIIAIHYVIIYGVERFNDYKVTGKKKKTTTPPPGNVNPIRIDVLVKILLYHE